MQFPTGGTARERESVDLVTPRRDIPKPTVMDSYEFRSDLVTASKVWMKEKFCYADSLF